jgi:hypothetical protein
MRSVPLSLHNTNVNCDSVLETVTISVEPVAIFDDEPVATFDDEPIATFDKYDQ